MQPNNKETNCTIVWLQSNKTAIPDIVPKLLEKSHQNTEFQKAKNKALLRSQNSVSLVHSNVTCVTGDER